MNSSQLLWLLSHLNHCLLIFWPEAGHQYLLLTIQTCRDPCELPGCGPSPSMSPQACPSSQLPQPRRACLFPIRTRTCSHLPRPADCKGGGGGSCSSLSLEHCPDHSGLLGPLHLSSFAFPRSLARTPPPPDPINSCPLLCAHCCCNTCLHPTVIYSFTCLPACAYQ